MELFISCPCRILLPNFLLISFSKNINQFFLFYTISTSLWMNSKTLNYSQNRLGRLLATDRYSLGLNNSLSFLYSIFSCTRLLFQSVWLLILPLQCLLPSTHALMSFSTSGKTQHSYWIAEIWSVQTSSLQQMVDMPKLGPSRTSFLAECKDFSEMQRTREIYESFWEAWFFFKCRSFPEIASTTEGSSSQES